MHRTSFTWPRSVVRKENEMSVRKRRYKGSIWHIKCLRFIVFIANTKHFVSWFCFHHMEKKNVTTDTDWRVCSWPWQAVGLGKGAAPLCVTSNRCTCTSVKNTLGWSAVVFCAWEIMFFFFCSVLCFRAVHKFYFRFVINETPNKWRPVEEGHTMTVMVLIWSMYFLPTILASVRELYPGCAGHLLSSE
jgi:hypothetical protein